MGSAFIQAIKGSERPRRGAGEKFFSLLALRKSRRGTGVRCRPFYDGTNFELGIFRVDLEHLGRGRGGGGQRERGERKAPPFHCKSIALPFRQKLFDAFVSYATAIPLPGFCPPRGNYLIYRGLLFGRS